MNGFDIAVLAIVAVAVLIGAAKGIVRILIGFAALVFAFLLASHFHGPLSAMWVDTGEEPSAALKLAAWVLVFFAVMLVGGAVAFIFRRLLKVAMLGWADRLAGAALGLLAAALAASLVMLPLVAYTPKGETILSGSRLAPYVTAIADWVNVLVPAELSERYRERIQELRRHWRGDEDASIVAVRMAPQPEELT